MGSTGLQFQPECLSKPAPGSGDADTASAPSRLGSQGLGHGTSLGHPWLSSPQMTPRLSDAALLALFAPYCGGLAREADLTEALHILAGGRLDGLRPVHGSRGHLFQLSWSSVHAPLEIAHCELAFPDQPQITYRFELLTHQLVDWLMDRSDSGGTALDLPDSFWRWLLTGADPAAADA